MRLSQRLRITHLISAVVPVAALGLFAGYLLHGQLREQTASRLQDLATIQANRIDTFVERSFERAMLIASRTQMRISLREWLQSGSEQERARIARILRDAIRPVPAIRHVAVQTPDMAMIVHVGEQHQDAPGHAGIPRSVGGAPLFDTFASADAETFLARVTTPLRFDGELLGYLHMHFDLRSALSIARERAGFGETGETLILTGVREGAPRLMFPPRFTVPEGAAAALGSFTGELLKAEEDQLLETRDYRGRASWVVLKRLPRADLVLATKIDLDEANALALRFSLGAAAMVLLAALAAIMLALRSSRTLTQPIDALRRMTGRMIAGERDARIELPAHDELGELAARFNEMAQGVNAAISKIEAANREHEQSEQRFRDYADVAADWFWEMDADLRFTYFSPRVTEVTGVPVEFHIGKTRRDLAGEDTDSPKWRQHLADLDARREFRDLRFARRGHDGRIQHLSSSGRPWFDADGHFQGYRGSGRDISNEVHALEAVEREKERAWSANQAKSQFLANMSHELRTPLNGVLGMLELLRDTPLTAEQADFVEIAADSGRSLLDIISDILDFSKIEARRLDLEHTPLELVDVVESAVESLAQSAQEKGLLLNARIEAEVPSRILGDAVRLRQILTNLVSNAIKFTDHGAVTVELDACAKADGRQHIAFAVSDTGIGIAPEAQGIIMDAFTQADSSTTRLFGGTGLGLAITRMLVKAMGGELQLASEPGEGSTFSFELEVQTVDDAPRAAVPDKGAVAAIATHNTTSARCWAAQLQRLHYSPHQLISHDDVQDRCPAQQVAVPSLLLLDSALDATTAQELLAANASATVVAMGTHGRSCEWPSWARHRRVRRLHAPARTRTLESVLQGHEQTEQLPASGAAGSTDPSSVLRVLLVEDNKTNQLVVSAMLQRKGHSVELAENGQEALRKLGCGRGRYDVVLMDCQMPVLDGLQATRAWRASEASGRRLPIIALTAGALPDELARCVAAGMNDCLCKPVSAPVLEETLLHWARPTGSGGRATALIAQDRAVRADNE